VAMTYASTTIIMIMITVIVIIIIIIMLLLLLFCFPAHDELGTCRTSLVFPLCITTIATFVVLIEKVCIIVTMVIKYDIYMSS